MKKRILSIIVLWLIGLIVCPQASASGPPKDPILRIETGMHTSRLKRIGLDASETTLITVAVDKTVRVWDVATGRLKKILRVPIDGGKDGSLYAATISPDGRTVAAGGWTGYNWDKKNTIYLFDTFTGQIYDRIPDLPNVIFHIEFSKDGRYMAACLGEKRGLRVWDARTFKLVAEDTDYEDGSYGADFDKSNRLVTVSYDGYVRLYDRNFRRIKKVKAPGGNKPFSVDFSPDGNAVAVGFSDANQVNVLSGRDLSFRFTPDNKGISSRGDLISVSWSADGEYLYAGGTWDDGSGTNPIRRWSNYGQGAYKDLPASKTTILHILPFRNGAIAFGASDPAWGIFDRQGNRTRFVAGAIADFRGKIETNFLVSDSGDSVQFGFEYGGKRPVVFSVSSRTLVAAASAGSSKYALSPPTTEAADLNITEWENDTDLKLNGKALKLKAYEMSRSLAIAPNRESFLIGTGWYIRLYDRSGKVKWKVQTPGTAWGVNISGDGNVAVAALGDGTIRWYRMRDGQPLMALFSHKDGNRWVLWTPSGYYAASAGADELIGWHVNRGRDNTPDFFPASKFRSVYYRPDVTEKVLVALDESRALQLADQEAGRQRQEIDLQQMFPPVVTILSPGDGTTVSDKNIQIRYDIRSPSGEKVTRVYAMIDGRPIGQRGIKRKKNEIQLTIPERDCEISIIAENRYSASEPASIQLKWRGKSSDEFVIKPKLYLLAVGVSNYQQPDLKLDYAAKDARDVAEVLQKQKNSIYRDISARVLTDEKATRDGVMEGLEWIERQTTAKDVAMLFLAGHGVNDRNGNYYYLPSNADVESLRRTGVAYSVIRDIVSNLPGKALFFVDTCHSGNVMGNKRRGDMADIDKIANDLASAENGVIVFASSTGRQYSVEDHQWKNGAFTKAIKEGLGGKADYTGDRKITINELDLYLAERVKELTRGTQTPVTAKPKTVPDFPIAVR